MGGNDSNGLSVRLSSKDSLQRTRSNTFDPEVGKKGRSMAITFLMIPFALEAPRSGSEGDDDDPDSDPVDPPLPVVNAQL